MSVGRHDYRHVYTRIVQYSALLLLLAISYITYTEHKNDMYVCIYIYNIYYGGEIGIIMS